MLEKIIKKASAELKEAIDKFYPDTDKIMAVLFAIIGEDSDYAREMIRSFGEKSENKWNDGTNYEESLDASEERIKENFKKELLELIALSIPVAQASDYLSERYMATRVHDVSRIIVTEKTRIDAEYEIEKGESYIYRCVGDGRTCIDCLGLDGKVFLSSQASVGVNLPPIHPWCRCSVETWTN